MILPERDARLTARILEAAIDSLDVILMLIFGKGAQAEKIVEWADRLCEKTRTAGGSTVRRASVSSGACRSGDESRLSPLEPDGTRAVSRPPPARLPAAGAGRSPP